MMSSGACPIRARCVGLMLAAVSAHAVPAQDSRMEIVDLARQLTDAAHAAEARQALLEMGYRRAMVEEEPAVAILANLVGGWALDFEQSNEVLDLLGELGPRAEAAGGVVEVGFSNMPLEVWPAALRALSRIAPHRVDTGRLLAEIFARIGQPPAERDHHLLVAWTRIEDRQREPAVGNARQLIERVSRSWGPQMGAVIEELGRRRVRGALGTLRDYLERSGHQSPVLIRYVRNVQIVTPFRDEAMQTAAQAMVQIDSDHPDSLVAHAVLLKHDDPLIRHRSMNAFGPASPGVAAAVPFLKANLFDTPPAVVADNCTALGMIGRDAEDAVIALEQLSQHEDAQIAGRAEAALRRIR